MVLELDNFVTLVVRRLISEMAKYSQTGGVAIGLGIGIVFFTSVVWRIILELACFCYI